MDTSDAGTRADTPIGRSGTVATLDAVDDLIAEATALIDHRTADVVTLALVRDELTSAVAACGDATAAADGCEVLVALDRALSATDVELPLAG